MTSHKRTSRRVKKQLCATRFQPALTLTWLSAEAKVASPKGVACSNVMLSEAKHPRISLKRNAVTLRCAQGDNLSTLSIFFRYGTVVGMFGS